MIIKPLVVDIYHGNEVGIRGDEAAGFAAAKAAGVLGVIHKASQGARVTDKAYERRRKMVTDAGMLWGAYHFNTGEDIDAQVKNFFAAAEPDAHTLMALDFEDYPASNMSASQAKQFLKLADDKLGRKLVLYGGNRIKENVKDTDTFFGSHRLWLCQYGPAPKKPKAWSEVWLWQYAADGFGPKPHTVPGIPGDLDCNTTERTAAQLAAEWA